MRKKNVDIELKAESMKSSFYLKINLEVDEIKWRDEREIKIVFSLTKRKIKNSDR
jgi:hypothetical protein